ncbi:HNH endonuclease [Spirulina subsalsa FACHB-351]|uniref:HNH endonuclease n=1 Tax=Spirulina subsalsa FACHB-351 TaxID=234711 RepID=A0ABT3LAQ9_9CYAN|nr:HNH endonuclease [Spirulina subsalsa]MCW6038602.1 HNH endonuclease [Spirulina subsalsa FACHB-351]
MSTGRRWTRDEQLIVLNLYCKLPFGQLHQRNPRIIEVADKLARTPASIAMKLVNFASLDPKLQARGVQGLKNVSRADQALWQELETNWDEVLLESETQINALLNPSPPQQEESGLAIVSPTFNIATEVTRQVKQRIRQNLFREMVLSAYNHQCCLTGNPVPELLIASHILPWSQFPEQRMNPHNGLCLARTQDAAFDRGLISFDENYGLLISSRLRNFLPHKTLQDNFLDYQNKPLQLPHKFLPSSEFLQYHRTHIYQN